MGLALRASKGLAGRGRPGSPDLDGVAPDVTSRAGASIFGRRAIGRGSFWSVPSSGGPARLLVRFDDLRRPSFRQQWALGNGRLYFPIEDRQADVWVVDVTTR